MGLLENNFSCIQFSNALLSAGTVRGAMFVLYALENSKLPKRVKRRENSYCWHLYQTASRSCYAKSIPQISSQLAFF